MSNTITQAQVKQFSANIHMLFQQEGSVLRPYLWEKPLNGKYRYFERLAKTEAVQKTTRHSPTPNVESQHSRRRAEATDWHWNDFLDPQDEIRILIQPANEYARNAAYALGRTLDRIIIAAFNAAAFTGEEGTTSVNFPSGQVIANGGTGFTIDKLLEVKRMMDLAHVPPSGRHIVFDTYAEEDLLGTTEITSADYNTVKALVQGQVNSFLGFTFHKIQTELPSSANITSAFAWHESSMGVVVGKEISTRMDERNDLSYAMQVYASATFGAVRIEDEGVVQIDYSIA